MSLFKLDDDADARERILRVSLRLFTEHGFAGVSTRQICQAVGVKQPSLYYHFGNKEGLYLAALQLWFHDVGNRIYQAIEQGTSLHERLHQVAIIFWSGEVGDFQAMQHDALDSLSESHQHLLINAILHSVVIPIVTTLQQGIDAGELPAASRIDVLTEMYWAMIFGIGSTYQRGSVMPPPLENGGIISFFLAGAKGVHATEFAKWPTFPYNTSSQP